VYHQNRGCVTFDTSPVSARPIIGSGLNSDGITFYEEPNFEGQSVFVRDSDPSLWLRPISSYIITGHASWSLFGGHHYSGEAICIRADIKPGNAPTAIANVENSKPPFNAYFVYSAKRGC